MEQIPEFKADNFWVLAMHAIDSMEPPGNLRNRNLTDLFYYELEQKVSKGELINININGPTRTGKSTAGAAICTEIKELIWKHHKLKRPMSNSNILRDQNEYSRKVKRRKESFKHECDVIDEWAEMELAGYNSTIEEKYLKQFSDVQAGRYYHRIACSPGNTTDANSDILLQSVPGSRQNGKTLFILSYRATHGEITQAITLGYIIVNVEETLKQSWYKTYLQKKEEKWELMNKHNVKSPRELEYAQIMLSTYNRTAEVMKMGLNKKKHFKIILQEEADKKGVWFSILGDKDVLETLEGMGELTQLVYETENKLKKMKGGSGSKELENYKNNIKGQLVRSLERLYKMGELWDQYQLIDEQTQ